MKRLDNFGERLVPGESHDLDETIRHKSSYRFFETVIYADRPSNPRILDLGCGVGHGAKTLSRIPGASIIAVDASEDAIEYAKVHYSAENIEYVVAKADEYLQLGMTFDYVVSRHALEHIPNGLELATRFTYSRRLIVNVPYMEPASDNGVDLRNPHHEINDINEEHFAHYPNRAFFFEDLAGVTSKNAAGANSIICIASVPGLSPVSVEMPFPAWRPSRLELMGLDADRRVAAAMLSGADKLKESQAALQLTEDRLRKAEEALSEAQGLLSRKSVRTALYFSEKLRRLIS